MASRVCDFSVFVDAVGFKPPLATGKTVRVVYQDACHLLHAQGVAEAPRRILRAIPGVKLVEITDPEICCGSAGFYNIEQPSIADDLGVAKATRVLEAKPDFVVSANIGCLAQLRRHVRPLSNRLPILHLAVFLQRAYKGKLLS